MKLPDVRSTSSRDEWLRIRRALGAHHAVLARTASQLYPEPDRLGDTGLIAPSTWLFPQPVDLCDLRLSLVPVTPAPFLTGTEDESCFARPLLAGGQLYSRYSDAIRNIAKPRLFEDRPAWRLLEVDFSIVETPSLLFGDTTYFNAIDVCEAVAHEAAARHLRATDAIGPPSWRGLHFRRLLGDPFDLTRRPVLPSTDTLTIRLSSDGASFVLHERDPSSVASSRGMLGVIPAGAFQPSTVQRANYQADFDLWHNIMREYSEEFLGNPEHRSDGGGVDYNTEPFRSLDDGLRSGKIRAVCFGIGLDALTLWAAILTAVVFDGDIYDDIFSEMVTVNLEGSLARTGGALSTTMIPFTHQVLDRLVRGGRLAPEASGCLALTWKHRRRVLVAT